MGKMGEGGECEKWEKEVWTKNRHLVVRCNQLTLLPIIPCTPSPHTSWCWCWSSYKSFWNLKLSLSLGKEKLGALHPNLQLHLHLPRTLKFGHWAFFLSAPRRRPFLWWLNRNELWPKEHSVYYLAAYRLRWLFRGFLATGYIARSDISGYIARSYIARYIWLYSQIYLAI